MKTLHIIVANKTATYSHRGGDIVCGNSDYQIEFNFDAEWKNYQKRFARFIWNGKYKDIEFSGSVCPVPVVENADRLEVGVYAEDFSVDPEMLTTTVSAVINCKKSIRCNTDLEYDGTVTVTEVIPAGYIKPSGTLNITSNGEHTVTSFEKVAVNVPSEGGVSSVGEWVAGAVYKPNDIVIYNSIYYICIKTTQADAVLSNPENTPMEWERLNGSYKGTYNEAESYVAGDIVEKNGSIYQANRDNPMTPPDNNMAGHWTELYVSENGGGITVGEWSPETTAYNIGDIVTYNGIYYICIKALPIGAVMNAPDADTESWERINGDTSVSENLVTLSGSFTLGGSDSPYNSHYLLHPYRYSIKEAVSGTVNGSTFDYIEVSGCGGDNCPDNPFTTISFTDSVGSVVASYSSTDITQSGVFVTVNSATRVTSLFYSVLTGMMAT